MKKTLCAILAATMVAGAGLTACSSKPAETTAAETTAAETTVAETTVAETTEAEETAEAEEQSWLDQPLLFCERALRCEPCHRG